MSDENLTECTGRKLSSNQLLSTARLKNNTTQQQQQQQQQKLANM